MSSKAILVAVLAGTAAWGAQSSAAPYHQIAATAQQIEATAQQIRELAGAAKPDQAGLLALANTQVAQTSLLIREFEVMQLDDMGVERDWVLHEKADSLADLAALEISVLSGQPNWRWLRKSAKQQAGLAAELSRAAGSL
jgi:hypothetical protein